MQYLYMVHIQHETFSKYTKKTGLCMLADEKIIHSLWVSDPEK